MAGSFNYRLKENYPSRTCVIKIWFGKKYFLWKAKALKQACEQIFKDLNRKLTNQALPETDLFFKVVAHCRRARVTMATVEVIFTSDDLPSILAFEQHELDAHCGDDYCLNICQEQYLPAWLKNVTPNKALQGTISPPDEQIPVKERMVKSGTSKVALMPKLSPNRHPVINAELIVQQMAAAKTKK